MKIRNGFVSNSSSSSFVISFHTNPKNVDEVRRQMFGDQIYHEGHSTLTIAEHVFRQIQEQGKATREQVFDSIHNGWFGPYKGLPGYFDMWKTLRHLDFGTKEYKEAEKKGDETNTKHAKAIVDKFMEDNKGRTLFVVEYADDTEWGGMMEHSGIFDNIPHIQTSYH